jgi:hypothetical protein
MKIVGILWLLAVEAEEKAAHFQTSAALSTDVNKLILEVSRYPVGQPFDFNY